MARIGVGIVTFERFERFKECFEHLLKNSRDVEEILIVDDCSVNDREKYDNFFATLLLPKFKVMVNDTNSGVSVSKNKILQYFYNKDYDYIFTLENDINIISPEVFNKYIETSIKTGYQYINFALHGELNKGKEQVMNINKYNISIYPNLTGAFSLHTKKLITEIGYYDEGYYNAYEHVDYCYIASQKELTTPFWMFIDVHGSNELIVEQPGSLFDGTRKDTSWFANADKGTKHFYKKHGVSFFDIPRP